MQWDPVLDVMLYGALGEVITAAGAAIIVGIFLAIDATVDAIKERSGSAMLARWRERTPWDPNPGTRWSSGRSAKWGAAILLIPYVLAVVGATVVAALGGLAG